MNSTCSPSFRLRKPSITSLLCWEGGKKAIIRQALADTCQYVSQRERAASVPVHVRASFRVKAELDLPVSMQLINKEGIKGGGLNE